MKNKIIIIIGILISINSCRMPSDPLGEIKIIKQLDTINTGGNCLDLDVDMDEDSVLVAASNYNGFMIYDIQYNGSMISKIKERIHISSYDMDSNIGDNRAQNVVIAPISNQAFILDKEDHIWLFDYNAGIDTLRAYLSKGDPLCYDARSLSIAIDESSNQIRIYSLIKHYSKGSYWKKDSRSLITTNIELSDINKDIECNYKFNNNDISDIIFYSDSLLTLGSGELGIQVYRFNEAFENTCVATNNDGKLIHINLDEESECQSDEYNVWIIEAGELIPEFIMAFDTPGEVESIYSKDSTIFVGLSNSNGFLKAIINSDGSTTGPHQFGVGYTIKGIDQDDGLLALAAGHDGILLYKWNGNVVSFMGKIETAYANTVKVKSDVNSKIIFAATEDGIEIIQIDF